MTSGVIDPWSSHSGPRPVFDDELSDTDKFVDYAAAMNHYAGPFCSCGDYSCPANNDSSARCVNYDDPFAYVGRYPESWTDEDIEAYEATELTESLISEARCTAEGNTLLAVQRINALGADLATAPEGLRRCTA
ncbi:hypothetical protein [Mycolicibacterium farcinogenes]|uniref:Uncharacterized protein n=1 Tax=Mycolicibacterium farcinogenes TaxID=1802 RepID=A0ACD1FQV3_MYCFR|nr:hypothetical protein [Mycolicibacterium farcinogenes]QZH69418.1 hypothetical protein K6L26_30960 [Mycolicibacterium farcinogenes]